MRGGLHMEYKKKLQETSGDKYADEQEKYVDWIFKLVWRNKERARDIYFLVLGFLGNSA